MEMISVGSITGNGGQRDGEQRQLHTVVRKNGVAGYCEEDEYVGSGIVFLHKKVVRGVRVK